MDSRKLLCSKNPLNFDLSNGMGLLNEYVIGVRIAKLQGISIYKCVYVNYANNEIPANKIPKLFRNILST